jgi:hypothetical protein
MFPLWQWIKNQIVQDVPEEIALCEFDCHKQQCTEKEWQTCPRRIALAAGELMPASGSKLRRAGDTLGVSAPSVCR